MKKYLALIILCSILVSGCNIGISDSAKKALKEHYIEMYIKGYTDATTCFKLVIEKNYPLEYCDKVLNIIKKAMEETL